MSRFLSDKAQPRMRLQKSIWFAVVGISAGLLAGCEDQGIVLGSKENLSGGAGGESGTAAGAGNGAGTGGGTGGDGGTSADGGLGGSAAGTGGAPGTQGGAGGANGGSGASGGTDGGSGGASGSGGEGPENCLMMVTPPTTIPGESDIAVCHGFDLGTLPPSQIAAVHPQWGAGILIHHAVLYQAPDGPLPSGPCPEVESRGAVIMASTPGRGSLELPADVGLEIGTGRFIVEAHYRNTSGNPGIESAGFCTEFTPRRKHTAAITRLGKQGIVVPPRSRDSFESTCSPSAEPFTHILSTTFNVGSLAKNVKMVVERSTGTQVLLERPDYHYGAILTVPTVVSLMAGNTIKTSCVHDNVSDAVASTPDETRCTFWALAYPLGALDNPAGSGSCGE